MIKNSLFFPLSCSFGKHSSPRAKRLLFFLIELAAYIRESTLTPNECYVNSNYAGYILTDVKLTLLLDVLL